MKKLAIIGAQRMAKNYAINAREMGIETYCFAWEKGAVAKEYVDKFYPISIFDVDSILDVLKQVGIDGIVSTSELTIAIAADLAMQLNLPSLRPDVAKVITNKYRNRLATRNVKGLHHPGYALVRTVQEVLDSGMRFPCIMKPLSEGGKRGVIVVSSEQELAKAFDYTRKESKRQDSFLVEEYLSEGREYSVESLSFHGQNSIIQITEKITSGPPHCVELGHRQPANLSESLRREVMSVIDRALTAVGVSEGPCHTEIKIIDDKVYLIEFNARPGGDFISYPLVDLSTGYAYLKGAIRIALGDFVPPVEQELKHEYAGVYFLTKQTEELLPLFNVCQKFDWCWRKNEVGEISDLLHNDCDGTNYFIYHAPHGIPPQIENVYGGILQRRI